MAVYKRNIVDINLETGKIHRSFLNHSIGMKDQKADHFGVRVFRDNEPVDLTGISVQGVFMPPQGDPIAITSGNIVSGNVAEVVLPQACYNYDGQFCLAIKLVDSTNSVTGTMRIVDGVVDNTHASGTVAPTGAVPTYQEVLSVYDNMVNALADYEETVEEQNAEIDEIKEVLKVSANDVVQTQAWEQGGIRSSDGGAAGTSSTRIRDTTYYYADVAFKAVADTGLKLSIFQYSSASMASYTDKYWGWIEGEKVLPGGYYYRVCAAYTDDSSILPAAGSGVTVTLYNETDPTLTKERKAADAKEVGDIFNTTVYYRGVLPTNTDLNAVTQQGMYYLNNDNTYIHAPSINEKSNLYVMGSTSVHVQIIVGRIAGIRFRFDNNGNISDWVRLADMNDFINTFANTISLTDSDDLDTIANTSLGFFTTSSIPGHAPIQAGGIVATFVYSSRYKFQIYMNGRNEIFMRMSVYEGWTRWKCISKEKDVIWFVVEKGGWSNKGHKVNTGVKALRPDRIFDLKPGSLLTFYLDEGWTYTIRHGSSSTKLSVAVSGSNKQSFVVEREYNAFQFNKIENGESVDLVVGDFDESVVIHTSGDALASTTPETEIHDMPESAGQMNVFYRAYQMSKITYETKNTLPLHSGGSKEVTVRDAPSGTTIIGIPYSSMRETMASVPQATSLQAFRTMIENPNSYVYTKHYEGVAPGYDYNSRCYVGAVCSTMVAYCYGIDDAMPTTISFAHYPGLNELPENQQNPQSLKLADMLNKAADHIVIVTDIIRTSRGKVKEIEVSEAWKPLCRSLRYTPEEIQANYFDNGFVAYRYEYVNNVTYTPSPWVHVDDDETADPVYNTVISPRKGEESNWMYGEDIEIDVLDNSAGYTHYVLTDEDSGTSESPVAIPSGNVITITGLDEGKYSVKLTDGTNDSASVRFDVIKAEATYTDNGNSTVRVEFESAANRIPSAVYWCANKYSYSDYKAVLDYHILTAEEIEAGYADVEEPTSGRSAYSDNGKWLMRMGFKTEFGQFASDLVEVMVE